MSVADETLPEPLTEGLPAEDWLGLDESQADATSATMQLGPRVTTELDPNLLPLAEILPELETPVFGSSTYVMQAEIGKGAMGSIFESKDQALLRRVAYKKMLPQILDQPEALARFLREVQITAQLEHPHIIPVYQFELDAEGCLAYAMKLIRGQTLKDLLQRKRQLLKAGEPLPPELDLPALLEIFLAVCDAMHYAHTRGVIHRDLKPANLMVGEHNEVYVMDWGIARRMGRYHPQSEESHRLDSLTDAQSLDETRAGQVLGTPRYMSPQQAAGKNAELDGRSDQFSLGLILFEILTLKPAFQSKNVVELLKKILRVEYASFTPAVPGLRVPRELQAIVCKALARLPAERYTSVDELAQDIRRFQQGLEILAAPDSPLQKGLRWVSRHRQLTLGLFLGVLLLSTATVGTSYVRQQQALAQARQQEWELNQILERTSVQAQKIDAHFLKMQGLLQQLAAEAQQLLSQGKPSSEPYFSQHPFLAPAQVEAPRFGAQISLDFPTAGFSPGKSMKDMRGKLQKLLPLRHRLKQTLLRSSVAEPETLSPEQVQELIAEQGTAIMWSHVSLEEGVIYMYPGLGFNNPDYDARTRPFYQLSAHQYGVQWGNPYFDPLSGALLPATTALYDPQGQFQGVAGIDLRFQDVIEQFMTFAEFPDLRESYLLNAKGEVIIRSSDRQRDQQTQSLTAGYQTPAFDHPALVQAVQQSQRGGILQTRTPQGQPRLLIFARLNTLGWYLVVELKRELPSLEARDGT